MQDRQQRFQVKNSRAFADRAYLHVGKLCDLGTRVAESAAEKQTLDYIENNFARLGMSVTRDSFEWVLYNSVNREVLINSHGIFFRSLFVNRFGFRKTIEGEFLVVQRDLLGSRRNCRGKILVTDGINDVLTLKDLDPEAVLVVRSEDIQVVQRFIGRKVCLQLQGACSETPTTAHNIVAEYECMATDSDKHIIVNAHWDCTGGPGANDNASGVGALLELAREFGLCTNRLSMNVKFIATGAEETGLIGSLAYVMKYSPTLASCDLSLTVDGVGDGPEGVGKPYLAMSPPGTGWERKVDAEQQLKLISTDNWQSAWFISWADVYWNSPTVNEDWIDRGMTEALDTDGLEFIKGGCCSGTDERPFAFMGVRTIQQSFSSADSDEGHHNEKGIPLESFKRSLAVSGQVSARILSVMIERYNPT